VLIFGLLGAAVLLTGVIHSYLWRRLVRDTTRRGHRWRRIGTVLFVALALLIPVTLLARGLPLRPQAWVSGPGYLWLALMFYLTVFLVLLEVPRLVARLALRRPRAAVAAPALAPAALPAPVSGSTAAVALPSPAPGPAVPAASNLAAQDLAAPDQGRRLLLARSLAITAGLAATGTVGYGVRTALGPPRLLRRTIVLTKLPRRLDGFRIALVADIHLGPLLGHAHTARIVSTINGLGPDLVAVVGDLVDGTVAELGPAAEPLRDLRATHGSYFVTGNHEYFSGYAEWVDEVRSLGVRPLRNERVDVDGLDLAGVNDLTGRSYGDGPDLAKALDRRDPAKPVVLLAHQPVQVHESQRRGVDLQLSGHTHGGQMYPFSYVVRLQQPVLAGYARFGGTQLFVTRGAGFWGPPVRVGAPPDITLIELRTP
jgi:predicted MPP superfamily phosphohydrolase